MSAGPGRGLRAGAFRTTFVLHLHGLERESDAVAAVPDNYPPYDLLRIRGEPGDGDILRLVFAVAGFGPDQLEITIAGDQLSISGEQPADGMPGRFLHRGIAARRFRRTFRLAPGLEVVEAGLDHGLLSVVLAIRGAARTDRTVVIGARS